MQVFFFFFFFFVKSCAVSPDTNDVKPGHIWGIGLHIILRHNDQKFKCPAGTHFVFAVCLCSNDIVSFVKYSIQISLLGWGRRGQGWQCMLINMEKACLTQLDFT